MNARLTMFLGTLVIGSFLATSIAVAQNEPQQRPDEHQAGAQQRQGHENAGQTGQQPQNRQPQQQQYHQQQQPPPQQQNRQPQPNHQQQQQQPQNRQPQQQQYHQQQQPQQQQNRQPQPNQQQHQAQQQYRQPQQGGAQQQNRQQQSNRGQQQYRPENRPQRWGRPPANRPTYNFRSNDRNSLRRYYASRFGAIDRARRPIFRIGGYLPYEDLGFFSPVPPGVWGSLPPIPYGYEAAYWDGYVVIYDPNTGYILYVTDLL